MGIFAEIVGAFASAPVMAAGAVAKGTGDAVQIGAKDMPVVSAAGAMLSQAGEYGMAAGGSIQENFANMGPMLGNVNFAALGRSIGGFTSSLTPGSQENSVALARAPEVEAPKIAPAVATMPEGVQHVSEAELFTASMSAPTFNAMPLAARGTGAAIV